MSRYRVKVDEHHGGGLYELEITTRYFVIDTQTDTVIMEFSSESSASYDGVGWADQTSGGVASVEISPGDKEVWVKEYGKEEVRKIPLP